MRLAALGLCLSGFIVTALPSPSHATLAYKAKTDADLFRSETLDPPPLAGLAQGESLKLLHRGAAQSLVETEGGIRGWIRNGDLQAMAEAPGQKMAIGNQSIVGNGERSYSPIVFGQEIPGPDVLPLDRSFRGEIAEVVDKEQLELRNGEN